MIEKVKVIKLVTGEEIVGSVEERGDYILVDNPVRFAPVQQEDGSVGLGGSEWSPLMEARQQAKISSMHVVCLLQPKENMAHAYDQHFGSGLITPPQGLALPH